MPHSCRTAGKFCELAHAATSQFDQVASADGIPRDVWREQARFIAFEQDALCGAFETVVLGPISAPNKGVPAKLLCKSITYLTQEIVGPQQR